MERLSHPRLRLSMSLLGAAALAGLLGLGGGAVSAAPGADTSPYFGRWTVSDPDSRFSARGQAYRTIDIAPCGRDFCGVSVSQTGACGATLFRFLSVHRDGTTRLQGHGVWGTAKKNVTIDSYETDTPGGHAIELNLGDGYDFGERGGSMPMFNATYAQQGAAQCRAR